MTFKSYLFSIRGQAGEVSPQLTGTPENPARTIAPRQAERHARTVNQYARARQREIRDRRGLYQPEVFRHYLWLALECELPGVKRLRHQSRSVNKEEKSLISSTRNSNKA